MIFSKDTPNNVLANDNLSASKRMIPIPSITLKKEQLKCSHCSREIKTYITKFNSHFEIKEIAPFEEMKIS